MPFELRWIEVDVTFVDKHGETDNVLKQHFTYYYNQEWDEGVDIFASKDLFHIDSFQISVDIEIVAVGWKDDVDQGKRSIILQDV